MSIKNNEDDVKFEKIVKNEKRRINKKLKIINSRSTKKLRNNYS